MNATQLKELIDKPKWYHHIPIIGVMMYALRFELKLVDLPAKTRKTLKFYRSIFNLVAFAIAIGFLVATLLLRDKHGFGHWPWIFWIGLGFGLSLNSTIYIPKALYVQGYKRLDKQKEGFNAN